MLLYLESRIIMVVYRTNFANNIFTLPAIINSGIFSVDGKVLSWENALQNFQSFLYLDYYE
jgi:ribosomal protein S4